MRFLTFQSTHPYRVWQFDGGRVTPRLKFQSTHPYRVWPFFGTEYSDVTKFQSTHPYRVWRLLATYSSAVSGFNPHTHTGCDCSDIWAVCIRTSFNPHTHTGCDLDLVSHFVTENVSIHTPIQGVTKWSSASTIALMFQSTHPYRVWLVRSCRPSLSKMFQSTHPYRVWHAY